MSFAYLTSTPGLKFNYSLYAIPAGWVVSYVAYLSCSYLSEEARDMLFLGLFTFSLFYF